MPPEFPLTCQVPEAWLSALDDYANTSGQSRHDVLKQAIAQFLDLEPTDHWQPQLHTLNTNVTKLTKQVHSLHKRLKTLEERSREPELSPVIAEILAPLTPAPNYPALPAPSEPSPSSRPFGAIRMDELCRLAPLNLSDIRHKANTAGISLYEAIEIETGWKYDPPSHTFAPPL